MINGNIDAFLDALACGEELLLRYRGVKYFVQGWTNEDGTAHLECWPYERPDKPYLWVRDGDAMASNAAAFLAAKLWDGRPFVEAEAEMEWVDE